MKTKRIAFGLLILSLLSCNYVTQLIAPPTATPIPTFTPTVTASPTPTATPLAPVYIPAECEAQPYPTLAPDVDIYPTLTYQNEEISKRTQLNIINDIEDVVDDVYVTLISTAKIGTGS